MTLSTFSRIGTANTYDHTLSNLQNRQSSLANLQENLTSGKRVTRASDDPTSAAQAERARTRIDRIAVDQRALDAQRSSISAAEGALGNINTALQNVRELLVNAGNGINTSAERNTIAGQIRSYSDQILSLANTKDSNGLPLFSGLGSALAPFVGPQGTSPDYTFKGLPGNTSPGEYAIPFALDGESAFMHLPGRDGSFNITVANNATTLIPASRGLLTDQITLTDTSLVATNAALAQATPGAPDYPTYQITFQTLDATTVPGTTTVTYQITETPLVSAGANPIVASASASYKTGEKAQIPITAIPGMRFTITGTPPASDKTMGTPVTGSPAVGDTITISPQRSVFSVLDRAITDIGKAANANAASQAVGQALHNIDTSIERISAVRGQAGEYLGRAERITDTNTQRNIEQETNRSNAEDVDMVKAISDFQNQQTAYQAALQSYAQIQKLSLFDYMR
jgi:flagellar hook-associated protein 3 FlgL